MTDALAVARLAGELAGLAGAGDVAGALAVHEKIGVLLGAAGAGAEVIDLAAARARRAR